MSENIVACIKNRATKALGILTRDETYSVSLKLGKIKSSIVKLQKKTGNGWKDISVEIDLLQTKDELRIIVEDNTGCGAKLSRGNFYMQNSNLIKDILNFSIPLKLEIRKFHGDKQLPVEGSDDIRAVITVIDLREDINQVKGVFSSSSKNSGKEFITLFNEIIRNLSPHDNCAKTLAPKVLEARCRISKIIADSILFYSNSNNRLSKYSKELRFSNSVFVNQWQEEKDGNGIKFITANIDFRPPPILGDNYAFRISIEKGPDYISSKQFIKYKNGKDCYETPKITIWRKIRLKLFVQGSNPSDISVYNQINWSEVKQAFNDAYIEIEYPTTPHPVDSSHTHPHSQVQDYFYIIPTDQWINYLDKYVYKIWNNKAWAYLKKNNLCQLRKDLQQYSFPASLAPSDNNPPTSWDFLGILAYEIAKDVMLREEGKTAKPNDAVSTQDCFYVLVCRIPSKNSEVCGMFTGGKCFYMVVNGDVTCTFAHEMGHALFLKHSATDFEIFQDSQGKICPIIFKKKVSVSEWDLHDSEDMISCIMSYENDYHGASNSVNWHFCGVCLLLLRFYDETKLVKNKFFKSIQYNGTVRKEGKKALRNTKLRKEFFKNIRNMSKVLRDTGNMDIAHLYIDPNTYKSSPLSFSPLKMHQKDKRVLLVLYPQEKVINNLKYDFYKDVSTHPRGEWIFRDPEGRDIPMNERIVNIRNNSSPDGKLLTEIEAVKKGKNTISFRIKGGGYLFTQSKPLTVEVV
ncbi:MAG: hypothetical protein QXE38_05225 [Candidatus Methanomethylicia archaeon]